MKLAPLNTFDRAVAYLFPEAGVRRLASRQILAVAGGYNGGKLGRRFTDGWNPGLGDADADSIWDLPTLRARARDASRNIPIARGLKNVIQTYTVGAGLMHHARPIWDMLPLRGEEARAKWQLDVERKFSLWCSSKDCDIERKHNFWQLQRLMVGSRWDSGDLFVVLGARKTNRSKYALALQLVEADRVSNPNSRANTDSLIEGVEVDEYGAAVAYNISKRHPGSLLSMVSNAWNRFPIDGPYGRRNVLHLAEFERPGQTRGVPGVAPFLEILKHLDDYRDAEQKAAIVASWFSVLLKTQNGDGIGDTPGLVGTSSPEPGPKGEGSPKLGPGIIASMRPGEDAVIINPGRPNSNFGSFIQSNVEFVGMGADVPYEVLRKHYDSSFSASRAAQQECWRAFKPRRDALSADLHEIYAAWLSEAVALGDVIAPGYFEDPDVRRAWQGDEWTGDAPISMDPLKEAQAMEKRLSIGVSDLSEEIAAYSGRSAEDVIAQRSREKAMLLAAGLPTSAPSQGTAPSPGTSQDPGADGNGDGQGDGQNQDGQQADPNNEGTN